MSRGSQRRRDHRERLMQTLARRRLRADVAHLQGPGRGVAVPGDVGTALLEAGEIPDPYFGNNEKAVMWVNQTAWTMEKKLKGGNRRHALRP